MTTWKKTITGVLLAVGFCAPAATRATAQEAASLANAHLTPGGLSLTVSDASGHWAHVMPTVERAKRLAARATTPVNLTYHGGPIMPTLEIYTIFWIGPLQGGGSATLSQHYQNIAWEFANDYVGHSVSAIMTQYYQMNPYIPIRGIPATVSGTGSAAGSYNDLDAFPTSGCTDSMTPGNCITDAQLQAELQKVMTLKQWTGGMNKLFLMFTGQGEGSCFDSTSASCAYTEYCGYHSAFTMGGTTVIYGNEPYAGVTGCIGGGPNPSGDEAVDNAVSVASHETSEAITDPLGNAWWDASGNEIGDKCAWTYGNNFFDNSLANQSWNGHYYELQMEYNNHKAACTQSGPN
jgi:hypothetical protein